jgi:hypothetical protein
MRLAGFGVLLLWSILVQFVGAFAYDTESWNNRDALDIDKPQYRGRLWSLSDNQIGYYLTHFEEARAKKKAVLQGIK